MGYRPPNEWVLADDDIAKWPEQFAALPPNATVIVPSGDDRYYASAEICRPLGREWTMGFLTWAEAAYVHNSVWPERLAGKRFDYTLAAHGANYRGRWPDRYPPVRET